MAREKILVIDDEKDIVELVDYNLEKDGHSVIFAYDGVAGLDLARKELPSLIILDLMLPEMDGLEVCRYLKQDDRTKSIPIIMLTAKSEESDIVVGLQLGADDYITKPFSPKVLLARVKAILRRMTEKRKPKEVRSINDLVVDMPKHKIFYKGREVELTPLEFNILEFLSRHPGRVFSRDQIMDSAWKEGKFVVDRAVDVHMRSLRKKMGKASGFIETVRGIGYRFKEQDWDE